MNILTVPPSPNWYEERVLACAPDNTVIYSARNDIVILENNTNVEKPANVRIITRAHNQRVLTVSINKNWGQPKKLAVSTSEDKIVKIWDLETGKKVASHDKHLLDNKVVGATFAGDEKVISVSDDGNIVIWNITLNETTPLSNIFGMKVSITCISTCPHATWLTAFGLKSGLVIVTDLRKNGKVLYKMRGHDKEILSLAWCPVPINIFPKNPLNYVGLKKKETEPNEELKVEETALESIDSGGGDYLKECEHLKNKILAAKDNSTEVTHEEQEPTSEDQQVEKDFKDNDKVQEFEEIKSTGTALPSDSPSELSPATDEDGKKEEIPVPVSPLEPSTVKDEASKVEATPVSDPSLEAVLAEDKTINNDNVSVSDSTLLPNSTKDEESTPEVTNAALESSPAKEETIKTGDMSDVSSGSNKDKDEAGKTTDENNCTKTNKEAGRSIIKVVSQEEEPRKEFLLASSAKESHIYIWRAGTDGRMQTFLTVPHKTKNKQKTFIDKIWISLCWITPKILLSSSKQNELLAWHLPKDQDHEKNMTVVHKDHSSLLFSIAAPMQLFDEYNWNEPAKFMNAWTTSQDRLLLNTNITKDRKSLACYPTLGGQVNCLQLSPLDPNRLAIGTTDCFIKSWDLSRPNIQSIYMRTFFNKVLSKVTALAWHPTNELILAFGTTEGRIGYLDPSNKAKATVIFRNHFRSQIYKLEWGPVKGNKEQLGLYAISDGRIVIFDPSQPTQEPSEFNGPSGVFLYSLAWMPDYSMLVVVTKEGYIIAYTPRLKTICKHYLQHRLQEITWHPNASDKTSTYHNWFAAISNFKNVVVYKFDIESGNNDENLMCLYQSESDLLHCVTWNPHEPSQLVIGCESGIAHILDAEKNQMIATYVNPNYEGIVSAVWSPLDPDFIICGSKDNTLRVWKVSENPPITEESVLIKERKKYIKENLLVNNHSPPQKVQQSTEEGVKSKKVVKNGLLPTFYAPKNVHQIICGLKKLLAWTEQSEDVETDTVDFTKNDILNIFGSDAAMQNLVSLNEISHKKKGKYDFNITLSLFRGDISTTIKEAIEEKRVTPWIISLAPMVSPKLWQSACETYADQLNEKPDSDPMETATYYLACHKVQNAVDCLCEAAMFKEALALAKCRMLGKDVASRIIEKWAEQAKFDGNFEVAAQCYIYLGKCEEAASLLFRRTDLETLEFVVQLSEKIGNEDLLNAAVTRYNAFKANEEPGKTQELPTRQEVVLQQNGHSPNSISSIEQANSSSEICNKSEESIEGKDTSAASNETDTDAAQAVVSINCSNVTTVQAGSCVKDIEGEDANKSSSDSIDTVKNAKDSAMQNNQSDDVLLKTIENEKHQDEDAGESLISEDGVKNEKTATKDESRENNSVIITEET